VIQLRTDPTTALATKFGARTLAPAGRLTALWCCLQLAACGFHLQGRQTLPTVLAAAHIEAVDDQSNFYLGLRSALSASGTALQAQSATGAAEIRIVSDGTSERVLAVSARNVQTAYQLSYTVKISVMAQGRELMAPEEHTLSREYSFDATALLAKEREKEALAAALADDLVTQVMRRLASL
jgi:LPS-assembly lipoprotein